MLPVVEIPYCVEANMLDCDILVSEFKLQSHIIFTFALIPLEKACILLSPRE